MRQLRDRLGWTQRHMAEQLGISHSHYSKLEVGTGNASIELLQRIAKIGDVSVDWLLTGDLDDSSGPSTARPGLQFRDNAATYVPAAELPVAGRDVPVALADAIIKATWQILRADGADELIARIAGTLGVSELDTVQMLVRQHLRTGVAADAIDGRAER